MDNILNSTVEMSQAELIFQLAKTNVEQEKRLKSTELRLSVLEEEMKKLSSKCIGNYGVPLCLHTYRGINFLFM